MADTVQQKQRGRPFAPGASGNPRGKPKGARARATLLGEKLLETEADDIFRALIDSAKNGDGVALRLCVERLSPLRRGRPVTFDLPKLETADDVGAAIGSVARAMAAGELSPDEAASVAGVIELKRRAIETSDLEKRIAALEEGKPHESA